MPRRLRLTIDERVAADGTVLRGVDAKETCDVIQRLLDERVEAIAVCLINAYNNPSNELAVARLVQEMAPNVALSLLVGSGRADTLVRTRGARQR